MSYNYRCHVNFISFSNQILHLQQGIQLNKHISTRLGLYNTKPSIGLDYKLKKYELNINLYDVNDLKYNITHAAQKV